MLVKGISISPNIVSEISKLIPSSKQKLRVVPNFRVEADYYDIKLGRKILGNTTYKISNGETFAPAKIAQFPTNWLTDSKEQPVKPFLFISYIELLKEKGQGLARKTMQILHELSEKKGCEGRMALSATPTTTGFYSHLGFDCPPKDQEMYDKLYSLAAKIAETKNLKKREFSKELKAIGCPTKTNGKYNTTGLRFFIPTQDNLSLLYKKH